MEFVRVIKAANRQQEKTKVADGGLYINNVALPVNLAALDGTCDA